MRRGAVGRRVFATGAQELQRGAGVLGNEVDQPATSAGTTSSRGPRSNGARHREAAGLERLAVDLGEQLALGEVERADGDRGPGRFGRRRPSPARSCTPRAPAPRRSLRARSGEIGPWICPLIGRVVCEPRANSSHEGRGTANGSSASTAPLGRVRGCRWPARARRRDARRPRRIGLRRRGERRSGPSTICPMRCTRCSGRSSSSASSSSGRSSRSSPLLARRPRLAVAAARRHPRQARGSNGS